MRLDNSNLATTKTTFYEDFYPGHLESIDGESLKRVIDNYLYTEGDHKLQNLSDIRSYIACDLISGKVQYIDLLTNRSKEHSKLIYIGARNDIEFKILNKFAGVHKYEIVLIQNLASVVLSYMSNMFDALQTLKRNSRVGKSKVKINRTRRLKVERDRPTVIIGLTEQRRFSLIKSISREIGLLGYNVIYYCANPKNEAILALEDEEIASNVIFDSDILQDKLEMVVRAAELELSPILRRLKRRAKSYECSYKGVGIMEFNAAAIEAVIKQRYIESRICCSSLEILTSDTKVCAYIGLDTYISTLSAVRYFNSSNVPTYFYFYNAIQNKVFYEAVLSFVNPTFFFLGSNLHKENLLNAQILTPQAKSFSVVGAPYGIEDDQEVKRRRLKLRQKLQLASSERVVILVSSYLTTDLSDSDKKALFVSTYLSSLDANATLVIKPHPNENKEALITDLRRWSVSGLIIPNETIETAVAAADVVCMYHSEAALTAFSMGVPVISVIPPEKIAAFDKHWRFYTEGVVKQVDLGSRFGDIISQLIDCERSRTRATETAAAFYKRLYPNERWARDLAESFDITCRGN